MVQPTPFDGSVKITGLLFLTVFHPKVGQIEVGGAAEDEDDLAGSGHRFRYPG